MIAKVWTTAPWDAHTASLRLALSGAVYDVLSLSLNKESTKESQPKAAAFGNCSFATLHSATREITHFGFAEIGSFIRPLNADVVRAQT